MPKGLELSRQFFESVRPLLERIIPDVMSCAAAGLVGEGSECLGFDDETSRDHDWGPAFCLWLPEELLRIGRSRVEKAMALLPREFMGFHTRMAPQERMNRIGPMATETFYRHFLGMERAPENWREWRAIPEYHLCSCTNGAVFLDNNGAFSSVRQSLLAYYPEDVRLKKIAARCMVMAQAGQYNLPRSLSRGETIPAMLAAARFAEAALSLVHLLNRRFMPFYKWAARSAQALPVLGKDAAELAATLAGTSWSDGERSKRAAQGAEDFCARAAAELRAQGLSSVPGDWLWALGPDVQMRISDPEIIRLNVMED
ncbi:MAG: DUF4037 domain-containing protein [Mailhella sp.]|nr:DUF4037 domain-containing protein [Mailhella sp.]